MFAKCCQNIIVPTVESKNDCLVSKEGTTSCASFMILMRCYEKKHGCHNVHKCKFRGDKIQVGNYVTIFKSEIKASLEGMLENLGLLQRR